VRGYLSRLFPKALKKMTGCEIVEQSIQVDHIHLLMVIPPKYAVSDVIGEMKQYTASMMREKFAWLEKVYWKERVVWSPGYFVSTVGLDEKQITEYVRWQGWQDSGQAKLDM
jgi:putative transposase